MFVNGFMFTSAGTSVLNQRGCMKYCTQVSLSRPIIKTWRLHCWSMIKRSSGLSELFFTERGFCLWGKRFTLTLSPILITLLIKLSVMLIRENDRLKCCQYKWRHDWLILTAFFDSSILLFWIWVESWNNVEHIGLAANGRSTPHFYCIFQQEGN